MMALRKVGVGRTVYLLLSLSGIFGIVFTQDDTPPLVAEHVEYQSPNEDSQPLNAIDPVPTEILEQPIAAFHQPELNDMDKASILVNEPPNAINQDPNEPVVVNQDTNELNHAPNVAIEAPSATHEPPNVMMQDAGVATPNVINQPHNVDGRHRASTVDFDYGAVESLEVNDDFQGLPGVQHEFRIEVAAGMSECIFQMLPENAKLHVSFQVLRGMDRNIEFLIQGPRNFVLEHIQWSSDASIEKSVPYEGLYRFCLNNEISKFSSKLVYFYMVTYIEEKWHQHSKNILEFFEGAEDIQKSLDMVDERMKKIQLEQASSRRGVISDWYLIQDNNSYVQTMSIVLCIVIVVSSAFQVFFVRHLFSVRNVNPKLKPRA